MPWVFEANADEQAALDEAEGDLNGFLDAGTVTVPDRDRRGFGADRFAAKPSASSALEIAWTDLVRRVGAPALPATVQVIGTVQRENPFTDHKFTLWIPG
jgi:hypothetical protein